MVCSVDEEGETRSRANVEEGADVKEGHPEFLYRRGSDVPEAWGSRSYGWTAELGAQLNLAHGQVWGYNGILCSAKRAAAGQASHIFHNRRSDVAT